jgi:hypothetical protein
MSTSRIAGKSITEQTLVKLSNCIQTNAISKEDATRELKEFIAQVPSNQTFDLLKFFIKTIQTNQYYTECQSLVFTAFAEVAFPRYHFKELFENIALLFDPKTNLPASSVSTLTMALEASIKNPAINLVLNEKSSLSQNSPTKATTRTALFEQDIELQEIPLNGTQAKNNIEEKSVSFANTKTELSANQKYLSITKLIDVLAAYYKQEKNHLENEVKKAEEKLNQKVLADMALQKELQNQKEMLTRVLEDTKQRIERFAHSNDFFLLNRAQQSLALDQRQLDQIPKKKAQSQHECEDLLNKFDYSKKKLNHLSQSIQENTTRLFYYYSTNINFEPSDLVNLSHLLEKSQLIDPNVYFINYVINQQLLSDNAVRKNYIEQFVKRKSPNMTASQMQTLVMALYTSYFKSPTFNQQIASATIQDFIASYGNEKEAATIAARALLTVMQQQITTGTLHQYAESLRSIFVILFQLIEHDKIDTYIKDQTSHHSIFEDLFSLWQQYQKKNTGIPTPDNIVLHHRIITNQLKSYYQINMPTTHATVSERNIDWFLQYVLWNELLPVLNQPAEFQKRANDMLGNDINENDIIDIRAQLIRAAGIPNDTSALIAIKNAIIHKSRNIMISAEDQTLPIKALLEILKKTSALIYTKNKNGLLERHGDLIQSESKHHKQEPLMMVKDPSLDYYALLVPAETVHSIQHLRSKNQNAHEQLCLLQMQFLFGRFMNEVFKSMDSHTIQQHFNELPLLLCETRPEFRMQLMHFVLGDPANLNADEKSESLNEKINTLFKTLASPSLPIRHQDTFLAIQQDIIKAYKSTICHQNIYFQLIEHAIDPHFYNTFITYGKQVEACFSHNMTDLNLLALYKSAYNSKDKIFQPHPEFIHLITIIDHAAGLIHAETLSQLVALNNHRLLKDKAMKQAVYNILRALIQGHDTPDTSKHAAMALSFDAALSKIGIILKRCDEHDLNYLKNLLAKIDVHSPNKTHHALDDAIEKMKQTHPVIDDDLDLIIDAVLHADQESKDHNDNTLLSFIDKLNKRKTTHKFNQPKYEGSLQKIIDVAIQHNDPRVIHVLTECKDENSRVNLDQLRSDNTSWLEYCYKQKTPSAMLRAIEIFHVTAELDVPLTNHHKAFVAMFLIAITQNAQLLNIKEYQNLFDTLLASQGTQELMVDFLKNLTVEQFKTVVTSTKISEKSLIHFGKHAVNAVRLDLFRVVCEQVPGNNLAYGFLIPELKQAFATRFCCNIAPQNLSSADLAKWFALPGIYTTYSQIISYYYSNGQSNIGGHFVGYRDISIFEMALKTKNTTPYTSDSSIRYLDAMSALQQMNPRLSEMTKIFRQMLVEQADKLSLEEITRLVTTFTSLEAPENISMTFVNNAIQTILTHSPSVWNKKLTELQDSFSRMVIEGLPLKEVRDNFLANKPNINQTLNPALQSTNKSSETAIDYFFRVYEQVQFNLAEQQKNGTTLDAMLNTYQITTPGQWNFNTDVAYMTALCGISHATLNMTPYHAQFVTVMAMMYAIPLTNELAVEVETGGGKTPIIGSWFIPCLLKTIKPDNVIITTLTPGLVSRDVERNKAMLDALGIPVSQDLHSNARAIYTTQEKLESNYGKDNRAQDNSVIIMDEGDVNRDRKGRYFTQFDYKAPEINPILRLIWSGITQLENDDTVSSCIEHSNAFNKLDTFLQNYVRDELTHFIKTARTVHNDSSIPDKETLAKQQNSNTLLTGAITTVEANTGIIAHHAIGLHGDPQFRQLKMHGNEIADNDFTVYEMPRRTIAYGDAIKHYRKKIAISGTLGRQEGYLSFKAAKFSGKRRVDHDDVLIASESTWDDAIFQAIKEKHDEGIPVIVFFEDIDSVNRFHQKYFKNDKSGNVNLYLGDESDAEQEKIVHDATRTKAITLGTIIAGRGMDYIVNNKAIDNLGGMKVIIACVIEHWNVYLQLLGRTARKFERGETTSILLRSKVESALRIKGIATHDLFTANLKRKMHELRDKVDLLESKAVEPKRNVPYSLSSDFYENVLPARLAQASPSSASFVSNLMHSVARAVIPSAAPEVKEDKHTIEKLYLPFFQQAMRGDNTNAVKNYNKAFGRQLHVPTTLFNIVLILDKTGSMTDQIQAAKEKLSQLPVAIQKSNPFAQIRVAVITFSDYQEGYNSYHSSEWTSKQNNACCQLVNFTDIATANAFLDKVTVDMSNPDTPEAIELAIYHAQNLNWQIAGCDTTNGDRIMNFVFVVSDSIPHGTTTSGIHDRFSSKFNNPARLDAYEEAEKLRTQIGAELHFIACYDRPEYIGIYSRMAGGKSYVTQLTEAGALIDKISKKIQESDHIDQLLNTCVSEQLSEGEIIKKLARDIGLKDKSISDKDALQIATERVRNRTLASSGKNEVSSSNLKR